MIAPHTPALAGGGAGGGGVIHMLLLTALCVNPSVRLWFRKDVT